MDAWGRDEEPEAEASDDSITDRLIELIFPAKGRRKEPAPPWHPCGYVEHREAGLDWINDSGRFVCGVCHPPARRKNGVKNPG